MNRVGHDQRADRPAFSLRPLMFENFVCALAMMSFVALVGPLSRTLGLAPWQAGTAVTAGGLAWIALSRPWGRAIDRHGRRRTLLQGLGGFAVSSAALCGFLALALHDPPAVWISFALAVILRGVAGGFYAAVPAAGAALIADHVAPERRAAAMAALGAAGGVGMVAGPGLAGLLAGHSLGLPLWIAAALPFLSLAVLWHRLPRTNSPGPADVPHLRTRDPRLRRPLIAALVSMSCVTAAQVVVGFFALDGLRLDSTAAARAAGIALTVVGVGLVLAQALVRPLGWSAIRLLRVGSAMAALGFASVIVAHTEVMLWVGYLIAAAGMGWVFPSVAALAANSVADFEQGATAGTIGAAQGLGMIVGPLLGTLAHQFDARAPYVLLALLMAWLAWWLGRPGR